MEDFENMGIKQLKLYIASKGGDYSDCVEKSDLKKRAIQVSRDSNGGSNGSTAKKPVSTSLVHGSAAESSMATPKKQPENGQQGGEKLDNDYVDENADLSSSDDEEEDPLNKQGRPTQKRFSVFRVKKFVTSKIGKTSAGRATVMKVLGEDGDVVVQALKSITTKIRDAKTAKENKKDGIRFCLKAYNLWKNKDFTLENTKSMQTDAQLLAEIFCREVSNISVGREVEITPLCRVATRIHDKCMQLMSPHLQPKNATRLSELLMFYASRDFFDAMLNQKDCSEERESIEKSANSLLLPLAPILSGERERQSLVRMQTIYRSLENKRFEIVLDHPQVAQLFQQYLDLDMGLASKNGLRFLLAVRDFEKTSSRELLKMRAPKIVEKFLSPSAEFKLNGINPATIANVMDTIATGTISMDTFSKVVGELRKQLEDDFLNQFTVSKDYLDLKKKTASEIAILEKQLIDEGSLTSSGKARRSVT